MDTPTIWRLLLRRLISNDVTMVGHSTGGGEVARYGRHGTKRVRAAVLIAAVPPWCSQLPIQEFQSKYLTDRTVALQGIGRSLQRLPLPFYGANRPGAKVSQATLDQFWLWSSMQGRLKNIYDSVKAFSETDFTEDLKKFDVRTLVMYGEDDQIVPINDTGKKSAKLIKGAKEIYYPGLPHGLTATNADQVNADLLASLKSVYTARGEA
jgi:non-heme chloroperoxidase